MKVKKKGTKARIKLVKTWGKGQSVWEGNEGWRQRGAISEQHKNSSEVRRRKRGFASTGGWVILLCSSERRSSVWNSDQNGSSLQGPGT